VDAGVAQIKFAVVARHYFITKCYSPMAFVTNDAINRGEKRLQQVLLFAVYQPYSVFNDAGPAQIKIALPARQYFIAIRYLPVAFVTNKALNRSDECPQPMLLFAVDLRTILCAFSKKSRGPVFCMLSTA